MLMRQQLASHRLKADENLHCAGGSVAINMRLRGEEQQAVTLIQNVFLVTDHTNQGTRQDVNKLFARMRDRPSRAANARFQRHQEGFKLLIRQSAPEIFHPDASRFRCRPLVSLQMNHLPLPLQLEKDRDGNSQCGREAV